ncbi:MAG: TOBE domain-containing protein [Dissulfurispiraceae bacterium]
MRISARNVLAGTITGINKGIVMSEVIITLKSALKICSYITNESVDNLSLKVGNKAYAIVKATTVQISKSHKAPALGTENTLKGTVARLKEGLAMGEVVIDIGEGDMLSASINDGKIKRLALRAGQEVYAIFKPTSVIIGVD